MGNLPSKVLVVDDNDLVRCFLKNICSHYTLQCHCVTNGHEAVQAFKNEIFGIVLMDLDMPVMGGLEATRVMRQYEIANNCKRTPVIAISGTTMINPHHECLTAGMDGFVPKPIVIKELIDIIKAAMDCETQHRLPEHQDLLRYSSTS
jgi:CheY-like chemotaxis protein